jgi:hypothetical protein
MREKIKKAIICKQVKDFTINRRINKTHMPKAGDVAVFRVLEIGKHKAIQGESGKNSYIFPGDYIMATFGNRYATNQFEGYVPNQYCEEYHILGMGGAIGIVETMHAKMEKLGITTLKLVGYATDKNKKVINTHYMTSDPVKFTPGKPRDFKIVLSVGSSMDSGKTTSAAYLCRGLKNAGNKVAFIKLTGTVFSKDKHFVKDCGADHVIDFSNLGFPSTYMYSMEDLLDLYEGLLTQVAKHKPDYVVMEIADGLLQRETNMLLQNKEFMSTIDDILLSCGDSLSVLSGIDYLDRINFRPFAISGLINVSPLLVKEVCQTLPIPVLTLEDLMAKKVVTLIEKHRLKQLSA